MPKYHWLPFLVWCISGSRSPEAFLVELGAAISVASTTVPALEHQALVAQQLVDAGAASARPSRVAPAGGETAGWCSRRAAAQDPSRCGRTRGTSARRAALLPSPGRSGRTTAAGNECAASSRSQTAGARSCPWGSAARSIAASADHGTTRSISSRNSRLRVFFVDRFSPRSACFIMGARSTRCKGQRAGAAIGRLVQSFPRRRRIASTAPWSSCLM